MNKIITLTSKSESIIYLTTKDKKLKQVFDLIGAISYELYSDAYAFLVETIVGQMLSNKVADVICKRVNNACDGSITTDAIIKLSVEDLRKLGLSYAKAKYILGLTEAVKNGNLNLSLLYTMPDDEVIKSITSINGLGDWSAKMFLIFVLGREDVLPYEDGAFLRAYAWLYKTDKIRKTDIQEQCRKWKPYSSIATRYLYKLLDEGYIKS